MERGRCGGGGSFFFTSVSSLVTKTVQEQSRAWEDDDCACTYSTREEVSAGTSIQLYTKLQRKFLLQVLCAWYIRLDFKSVGRKILQRQIINEGGVEVKKCGLVVYLFCFFLKCKRFNQQNELLLLRTACVQFQIK